MMGGRITMEPQPLTDVVTPGPEGLAEDLPCPKCGYNLRGLTIPRCPECGFAFGWQDLPELRQKAAREPRGLMEWICLIMVVAILLVAAAFTPLLAIAVPLAISGVQACIEVTVAWPILRPVGWRRLRAWWEGVLIGYGLCAVTCRWSGRTVAIWTGLTFYPGSFSTPLLLFITAVESFLVQWWVVSQRARQWNDPVPTGRLVLACLAAKAFMAIPWSLIATGALAR
jgi:hypothetical protein